jgi:hypothetical protein
MLTRRRFLATGAAGATLLLAARVWHGPWLEEAHPEGVFKASPGASLSPVALSISCAVAPVLLGVSLKSAEEQRAFAKAFEATVNTLPLATQREVADLFKLLSFGPARAAMTGLRTPWSKATPPAIEEALKRLRHSRITLMQSAYHALRELCAAAWYADSAHWGTMNYQPPVIRA